MKNCLWTKIKHFAERMERKHWLSVNFNDQKCPFCMTWQGNCGGWAAIEANIPDEQHDRLQCGKCRQWSTWFAGAPVLFLVDPRPDAQVIA